MSTSSQVSLGAMRLAAQEASDFENNPAISTEAWNQFISQSYKRLYDLLISAYGNDYYVSTPLTFQTDGVSQLYPLPDGTTTFTNPITAATVTPPAFYKLLGIDLALVSNQSQSYVTIRPFNFADRNRYAVPNFQSFYGVTNLRYRIQGDKLWFTPIPAAGQTIQIWQVPRPVNVQQEVICSLAASTTVTCSDTSNLITGMLIQIPTSVAAFPVGTTIATITPNTSFTTSNAATITSANILARAWSDSTQIDGISGWEEYIVLDATLKAMGKEESDISLIAQQKLAMKQRLIDMAANRDVGNPATVADVQWSDFGFPTGSGNGSGWGSF